MNLKLTFCIIQFLYSRVAKLLFRFQVILDVQQFSPDEIIVKTVDNNIIVEAKHEERKDEHGFITRHFIRRYILPSSHDSLQVTSSLSSDGVLTITAPKRVITWAQFLISCLYSLNPTGLKALDGTEAPIFKLFDPVVFFFSIRYFLFPSACFSVISALICSGLTLMLHPERIMQALVCAFSLRSG